jgi:ferredoxin
VSEPPDELDLLIEAAAACPNFAITVEVDGSIVFDPEVQ